MATAPGLSAWFRSRWERLDGPRRLPGIDLARGLAVVGMLAAHLLAIDLFDPGDPSTWIDVVNGRSSILFATLAGVSIALVTGGAVPLRGASRRRAAARLAIRAGALWVIGILLAMTGVPVYVILPAYALLFLLALPFLGMRPRSLFALAAGLALVMPFVQAFLDASPFWATPEGEQTALFLGWNYPFPTWIAFLLAGMAAGRMNLRGVRHPALLLGVGLVLAAVGYGLDAVSGVDAVAERLSPLSAVWTARAHSSGLLEVIGSGGFALFVVGLCILLCRTVLRWLVVPLRAVGSMPLTAYSAQILVWAVLAATTLGETSDLSGFRDLHPFWPLTIGIVLGATAWTILIGRGPLEAGIDALARWVVPATARQQPVTARGADTVDG